MKVNGFEKFKLCILEKQADLYQAVTMITYNMLIQKYYFC